MTNMMTNANHILYRNHNAAETDRKATVCHLSHCTVIIAVNAVIRRNSLGPRLGDLADYLEVGGRLWLSELCLIPTSPPSSSFPVF
jgi:hypothetical protein